MPFFGPLWCAAHNEGRTVTIESLPQGTRFLNINDTQWTVIGPSDVEEGRIDIVRVNSKSSQISSNDVYVLSDQLCEDDY
jgi:hypothetical protein